MIRSDTDYTERHVSIRRQFQMVYRHLVPRWNDSVAPHDNESIVFHNCTCHKIIVGLRFEWWTGLLWEHGLVDISLWFDGFNSLSEIRLPITKPSRNVNELTHGLPQAEIHFGNAIDCFVITSQPDCEKCDCGIHIVLSSPLRLVLALMTSVCSRDSQWELDNKIGIQRLNTQSRPVELIWSTVMSNHSSSLQSVDIGCWIPRRMANGLSHQDVTDWSKSTIFW
jgi:hypothetical protein